MGSSLRAGLPDTPLKSHDSIQCLVSTCPIILFATVIYQQLPHHPVSLTSHTLISYTPPTFRHISQTSISSLFTISEPYSLIVRIDFCLSRQYFFDDFLHTLFALPRLDELIDDSFP